MDLGSIHCSYPHAFSDAEKDSGDKCFLVSTASIWPSTIPKEATKTVLANIGGQETTANILLQLVWDSELSVFLLDRQWEERSIQVVVDISLFPKNGRPQN
jgi:hypothetical protein